MKLMVFKYYYNYRYVNYRFLDDVFVKINLFLILIVKKGSKNVKNNLIIVVQRLNTVISKEKVLFLFD